MTRAQHFARLRRFEFRRGFGRELKTALVFWSGSGVLERLVSIVGAIFGLCYAVFSCCFMRGMYVRWAPAFTPAIAVPWLLWGFGGLVPLVGAVLAGMSWGEIGSRAWLASAGSKPVVALVPLSEREVLAAKLQARAAAMLVYLAIGFALDLAAVGAMAVTDSVVRPPSLADPWLLAAVLAFYSAFVFSESCRALGRRTGSKYASVSVVGAWVLCALPVAGLAYTAGAFLDPTKSPWAPVAYACVAAISVTLAGPLRFSRGLLGLAGWKGGSEAGRGKERAEEAAEDRVLERSGGRRSQGARWSQQWGWAAIRGYCSPAICGLGGDAGWTRRRLGEVLAMGLGLVAAAAGASWLCQALAFLWHAGSVLAAGQGTLQDPDHAAYAFAIGLATVAPSVTTMMLGWAAWPDQIMAIFGTVGGLRRVKGIGERRHLGLMLPARAEAVWRRRLGSMVAVDLVLLLATIVVYILSWLPARLACGPTFPPLWPLPLWLPVAMLSGVVLGLCLFCWLPLVRCAVRFLPLSGCVVAIIAYAGFVGGSITSVVLEIALSSPSQAHHAGLSPIAFALPGAWLVLFLLVSPWVPAMARWPVEADGSPAGTSKLGAALVWLSLLPTGAATSAMWLAAMNFFTGHP